jgi:hypothetical protein
MAYDQRSGHGKTDIASKRRIGLAKRLTRHICGLLNRRFLIRSLKGWRLWAEFTLVKPHAQSDSYLVF